MPPKHKARGRGNSPKKYAVFLSHSHKDQWLAGVLSTKIQARNVEVWLDEMSLQGGDDVMTAVLEGIEDTNETVVLVSHEALRSQWVATGIGIAKGKKKRVTPLLNNVDPDAFPPLKGVKSYELNSFNQFLTELAGRAKGSGRA